MLSVEEQRLYIFFPTKTAGFSHMSALERGQNKELLTSPKIQTAHINKSYGQDEQTSFTN